MMDIEDEMEKWEKSISERKLDLKGEVILSTEVVRKDSFIEASFDEPKKRVSKRTKEEEVDLKKSKKRNKSGLF